MGAALAIAVCGAGCTEHSEDGKGMRVTLSGDGCRYEGRTTPAPGSFALDVRNDTNKGATIALLKFPTGATLKDVETWFHQALRRWQRTGKYILRSGDATYLSWISSAKVAPHAVSELPVNMFRRARLAVLCAPWNRRPFDVIVVAELDVTP